MRSNVTIVSNPVEAEWHKLSTPELLKISNYVAHNDCYNRDTIQELVGALASRLEETLRVLGTYKEAP